MLAAEMKNIKTASIKRELKRKLLDLLFTAQTEDEELKNVHVFAWYVDPTTATQPQEPTTEAVADQPVSSGSGCRNIHWNNSWNIHVS